MATTEKRLYQHSSLWSLLAILIACCVIKQSKQASINTTIDERDYKYTNFVDWEEPTVGDGDSDADDEERLRSKRYMKLQQNRHWPRGIIPYAYDNRIVDRNKRDIVAAMAFYEYNSHIRFKPYSVALRHELGHSAFLNYKTTWGRGWSLVGIYKKYNGQELNCPRQRTCVHEMGHALGFFHEQNHPGRDKWMRVNTQNLGTDFEPWNLRGWRNVAKTRFDYASFMLYPPNYKEYDVLFPELYPFEQRPFYMLKEMCTGYDCEQTPECINKELVCANDGYVSVVNGQCSCVCLPGLDPKTECRTVKKKDTRNWPSGTFSLLEHKDGCPNGYFREGQLKHYGEGDGKQYSTDYKGTISDTMTQLSFCTVIDDSEGGQWPPGKYCFLKRGSCPDQKGVYEGRISQRGTYDTKLVSEYTGYLPDGDHGRDASIEYCCMHSGFTYMPAKFPNEKPFILFAKLGDPCQQVEGMSVRMEKLGLYNPSVTGDIRWYWGQNYVGNINYCVYTPANTDCGDIIEMGPNKQTVTIEAGRSHPSNRECNWLIQNSDGKGTLVLTFDELDVKCDDYVEVQPTMLAQKGVKYCGNPKDKSLKSLFGKLRVQFKTEEKSNAHFKATVKWISDSDLCYDAKDNGANYRETMNYTRGFEPCLPWSEVSQCLIYPNSQHYTDGLEGNYCRNMDDSFYPWCYTKAEGCKRDFCDVCLLETPYDRADDCADRKRNGKCRQTSLDCAQTCGVTQQTHVTKVSDHHCSAPNTISGGDIQSSNKTRYDVGDIVTFKCRRSGNTIETTCQSNGEWSDANTACLPCPQGYYHYRDNCYKLFNDLVSFDEAEKQCHDIGAELAMPQSQGESDFIHSIRYPVNLIWIGGEIRNNRYTKTDHKTPLAWFDWKYYDVPHPERCVFMREDTFWKDTNSCDWEFKFICQKPVTDDQPECKDFINNCQSMVSALPDSNCDLKPGLETYCRYTCGRCPDDCHQDIQLTTSNKEYIMSADRTRTSSRYCTWTIKPPNKNGRLVLKFQDFQVKSSGGDCVDGVEVKTHNYGPPYTRHCDAHYNNTVFIAHDEMLVRFIASEASSSRFTAHIEWIPDPDMCYNAADKGWSYDGTVDYTRTNEPCLSWAEAFNCENNTLWNEYHLDNLEHNYCRNPDPEHHEQPYCYTTDCVKKPCDVCHLEKPSDNSSDCQSFKNAGKCKTHHMEAAAKCAETCRSDLEGIRIKVSGVTCPRPGQVVGGVLSQGKSSYIVGEHAVYNCNKRNTQIKRTCLASGDWSTANTACLDCPYGFILFKDQCYKYFPLYVDKDGANDHCRGMGADVATPKNSEQNHFIASLRENERIWLGGTKGTNQFMWSDGTRVSWPNWSLAKKKYSYRDNCMVLEKDETWTDDWCRNKLFHFICQIEATKEQEECVNYLNTCPSLIQAIPQSNCDDLPSLQLYCKSSCGLCLNDCKKDIHLSSNNQIYKIDTSNSQKKFCSWNFQGDDTRGRFIITLDEFDVRNSDSLIMKLSNSEGHSLHEYSNAEHQKVTYIYKDHIILEFKGASNSKSSFKATVRWVKDSDMCYDVADKGHTYVEKVSFTKTFRNCLAWSDLLHCPHNPLKNGNFLDHLDKNYCRNPDNSSQPWCYVSRNCEKQACDVCHLEKLHDVSADCHQRDMGMCNEGTSDCAKSCQVDQYVERVSDIRCGRPPSISGGVLEGSAKNQYNVGDKVVYRCSKNNFDVDRWCLTSGEWSVAETVCMACPLGFTAFRDKCYMYVNKKLTYADAEKECQKHDSRVATPKTPDENNFIVSYCLEGTQNILWIGANKMEDKRTFYWNDNTPVSWVNWRTRKVFKDMDKCVRMERYGKWFTDWCHDKYFNFVCQRKSDDQPECKDFLDDCPYLLSLTRNPTCEPNSRIGMLCRRTCGFCPRDCDHTIQLSPSSIYDIALDRRTDSRRYCTWTFTVPPNKNGVFAIQFNEFEVLNNKKKCVDSVEIKESEYGPPQNKYYCTQNNYQQEVELTGDSLFVRFKTVPNSQSHFKARVKWTDDDSMCYSVKDNGRSYNGNVNYTQTFKFCTPWVHNMNCPKHPFKEGNLLSHLGGNACRNPDNSERPWCYLKECYKEYCDVCHLADPKDIQLDCATFKKRGMCRDPTRALEECAATCDAVPSQHSTSKASDVRCGDPQTVSSATITSKEQQSYRVGDEVTYKCSRSSSLVTSTCLTSGQWSDVGTPCLTCPSGWTKFEDKCYLYVKQFLSYENAEEVCKSRSAIVATAKTKAVDSFLLTFKPNNEGIWLGAKKESDAFYWVDGDPFTYTNWDYSNSLARREKCVYLLGKWIDDWCNEKYYSFVCQLDSDESPECVDFMDTCSDFVQYKNQCDSVLNKYCRRSCGLCNGIP